VPFTTESIPNLTGKTALITGANSGLGLESARALAAKGAHVILAVRSEDKGRQARDEIAADHPLASLEILPLDLSRLASVRAAAETLKRSHKRLDILLNNAGVMATPYTLTEDGFELQFGTNHLGHFALTGLLFELLLKAPGARVVNVSSQVHLVGRMRFDDLAWQHGYSKWGAYNMSKVANLLFTYELARRIASKGLSVLSVAAHPGYAATNLQQRGAELSGATLTAKLIKLLNPLGGQSAAMGALPQLYAATAADVLPCDYVGAGAWFGARGYPKKTHSAKHTHDPDAMRRLWEESEALTSVRYEAL
jgi:NAD(P)-dependent dehydrogenase (short-subunit alcohol dehydrogenase family)